ncbi:hypothetical protein D1AOALGA4SA_4874 [Olavius algarvensis Delta 1 endosymbiont]|nr:hypothetical protein D1AOALGA4SA_4874 [Olavius algarvensis Delta 1 endosymbiont]
MYRLAIIFITKYFLNQALSWFFLTTCCKNMMVSGVSVQGSGSSALVS